VSEVTVREALAGAVSQIAAAGCATPRLDAEVLLAHALGVSRERLLCDGSTVVGADALPAFRRAVRRRTGEREAVAYITGRRAFRRLQLAVDRRALIPRPETELLVEVALALPARARVLDVGTGSGAVALALKQERPDLCVTASDVSEPALSLARENAAGLDLDVRFLCADLLEGLDDRYDALLANLPYVAEGERAGLAPEIARHEPAGALFAGADGLATIGRLLTQLARWRTVELVALEVGADQARAVAKRTRAAGFATVRCERDLAGIERVVVGHGRRGR
jgi:release factor glutamine methyltransferase